MTGAASDHLRDRLTFYARHVLTIGIIIVITCIMGLIVGRMTPARPRGRNNPW